MDTSAGLCRLGQAIAAPECAVGAQRIIQREHHCTGIGFREQRQAGLGQPPARSQVDMDGAGEISRVGMQQRRQALELGGAMQDAIETAQFRFDARREFGVVVRRGADQVKRIQQRLGADGARRVVHAIERRDLAAQQHHGRARACAGHGRGRTQAAGGTGDQDDATFERRACCSRLLRVGDDAGQLAGFGSSTVMSQPPISSPLMKSCGNVGQSEKRGRLARISGSSSTFTVCSCAPAALSACTERLEKPHIGNCGVPFMKRTMGWPSISARMRSSTEDMVCSCNVAPARA
jgi:hypothetical protein